MEASANPPALTAFPALGNRPVILVSCLAATPRAGAKASALSQNPNRNELGNPKIYDSDLSK